MDRRLFPDLACEVFAEAVRCYEAEDDGEIDDAMVAFVAALERLLVIGAT